jgi:hypothetical protein
MRRSGETEESDVGAHASDARNRGQVGSASKRGAARRVGSLRQRPAPFERAAPAGTAAGDVAGRTVK